MKQKIGIKNGILFLFTLFGLILFVGCQDNTIDPTEDTNSIEKQEVLNAIDSDSLLISFEPNYNEDGVLNYLQKTEAEIKPFKVWHRMKLIDRNVDISFDEDTAYAHITNTFEGTLFIASSYDPSAVKPDTVIKKSFTSVVTRNVVLVKIANTENVRKNWVVTEVSLPQGGTQSPNIEIKKVTVTFPNGETLEITSPNDYYLVRKWGWWWRWHNVPVVPRDREVTIRVEVTSAYEENDFVSLTFGADRLGAHRSKKLFELVSSTPNGSFYDKVYEQTFVSNFFPGFFHAIVNLMPQQVIKEDSTPVELESWGIPYFVKL